ncbi:MAG: type I-MYXAN CRISPR-associated protein Cas6/Cmx6 [Burkholderiaceae bacterium]|nr:type I-MYXAN CRISPR-associated protein Cas6/Cmx6 [Burkholderiaceae bacterium]
MSASSAVDFAYAVSGDRIGRDYARGLYRALTAALPWLDDEPLAGVHPMRGLTPCADGLLVGGRTRLMLRAPVCRTAECERLQGSQIEVPAPLTLGRVSVRELLAYPVLHAKLVVTGAEDEADFIADVERGMAELNVDGEMIVGRRAELQVGADRLVGFSLMLHGLSPAASLHVQEHGLGLHRKLGCGLFVPHKSIAAVGG